MLYDERVCIHIYNTIYIYIYTKAYLNEGSNKYISEHSLRIHVKESIFWFSFVRMVLVVS